MKLPKGHPRNLGSNEYIYIPYTFDEVIKALEIGLISKPEARECVARLWKCGFIDPFAKLGGNHDTQN